VDIPFPTQTLVYDPPPKPEDGPRPLLAG